MVNVVLEVVLVLLVGCFYTGDGLSVWANLGKLISVSDISSECKYGHEDDLSVQTSSRRTFSTCHSSSRIYTGDVE